MGTAIDSQGYAADSVAAAPNLHAAVAGGDIGLVELLVSNGADVNEEDLADSETPLYRAAGLDDPQIAQVLLAAQADVNWSGSEFSFTALHKAVCLNNFKMVEVLLKGGAYRDETDESGSTPLSLARSVQLRLEAELDEAAENCGHVCMRELERQEVVCELEQNCKIRDLLS
ncbi:N [Symbiodinium pilosum]|uniref:N protein n=1 Tax=Symbiodinium pilosum TaxID=2952 RepID=A0A812LAK5_SYMPI|nr:N [Symbiodinium pilosum] [Symbiodinium pilosum]